MIPLLCVFVGCSEWPQRHQVYNSLPTKEAVETFRNIALKITYCMACCFLEINFLPKNHLPGKRWQPHGKCMNVPSNSQLLKQSFHPVRPHWGNNTKLKTWRHPFYIDVVQWADKMHCTAILYLWQQQGCQFNKSNSAVRFQALTLREKKKGFNAGWQNINKKNKDHIRIVLFFSFFPSGLYYYCTATGLKIKPCTLTLTCTYPNTKTSSCLCQIYKKPAFFLH